MKRTAAVRVGDRADHRQAVDPIEHITAYNKSGPPPPLFMTGLGVKVQVDNIPLLKNRHHTSLPSSLPQSSSVLSMLGTCSIGTP